MGTDLATVPGHATSPLHGGGGHRPPPDLSAPPDMLKPQGYGYTWSPEDRDLHAAAARDRHRTRFLRDEPSLIADPAIYAANLSTDDERRDHHRESRRRLRRVSSRQQKLGRSGQDPVPPEESPQPPVQFSVNCQNPQNRSEGAGATPAPFDEAMCRPYQEGHDDPQMVYTDNHPELLSPTPPWRRPPGTGSPAALCKTACGLSRSSLHGRLNLTPWSTVGRTEVSHFRRPHLLNFDQRFLLPRQDRRLAQHGSRPVLAAHRRSWSGVSIRGSQEYGSTERTENDTDRS